MSLKYRLMSDLHLEFGPINVPVLEGEDKMTLVLAGDIAVASVPEEYVGFINEMCDRHDTVIWVLGNHEYYMNYIEEAKDEIEENFDPIPDNLSILEYGTVVVGDVAFICATMWTDYHKQDPMTMMESKRFMNDHRVIQKYTESSAYTYGGYRKDMTVFLPNDALKIHMMHRSFVMEQARVLDVRAKVLVTHHGFSYQSIGQAYKMDHELNGAFVSNMDQEILDGGFAFAHHGHTHQSFEYEIGDTKVITNPRGYMRKNYGTSKMAPENSRFNDSLVIEV